MNMMTPENLNDLTKDAEVAENPALAKLMKAWESKNAKRAAKGTGLTLMAVSLAACGGSSSSEPEEPEVPEVPLGKVFTLTADKDTPSTLVGEGSSGIEGDIFNAPTARFDAGLLNNIVSPTLQGDDVLVGNEDKTDILTAQLNSTFGVMTGNAPSITNIEEIYFQVLDSPALPAGLIGNALSGQFTNLPDAWEDEFFLLTPGPSTAAVDFKNVSGAEQVWMNDSNDDSTLLVYNVQEQAIVGMKDVHNAFYGFNYEADALGGDDDASQTIVLIDVTGEPQEFTFTDSPGDELRVFDLSFTEPTPVGPVTYVPCAPNAPWGGSLLWLDTEGDDAITTVDIDNTGNNSLYLTVTSELEEAPLETINVTGTGSLSLRGDNNFFGISAVNAASFAGALDIDLSGVDADKDLSVLLGAGNDVVMVDAGLFAGDGDFTMDGGAGSNTLVVTGNISDGATFDSGITFSFGDGNSITNVQTVALDVDLDIGADVTFDLSAFGTDDLTINLETYKEFSSVEIVGGPESLTGVYCAGAEYGTLNLGEGVENFTVNTKADFEIGELRGEDLQTLTLNDVSEDDSDAVKFDITLEDTSELTTINLNGKGDTTFEIDAENAGFESAVTINIGDFGILEYTTNEDSIRETFKFVGDDIGNVTIHGFEAGIGANRDQIDFSQFAGVNDTDDLIITEVDAEEGHYTIEAADGQFEGTITLFLENSDASDLSGSLFFGV